MIASQLAGKAAASARRRWLRRFNHMPAISSREIATRKAKRWGSCTIADSSPGSWCGRGVYQIGLEANVLKPGKGARINAETEALPMESPEHFSVEWEAIA